jgi:anti-sigma factor RsiW
MGLLLRERLSPEERVAVEGHLESCAACQEALARLAAQAYPVPALGAAPPAGDSAADSFLGRLRQSPPDGPPAHES